jgi:homoserine kinase type II
MTEVFLLQHSYEKEIDGLFLEETKIIGIYSSEKNAEGAVEKYKKLPGFKDYPDAFYIDRFQLDMGFWVEGFITGDEALKNFENEEQT